MAGNWNLFQVSRVHKKKPASKLPKMSSEGVQEAESSLLYHKTIVGPRPLEPDGTSKEAQGQESAHREISPLSSVINKVSTLPETEGKAQEAPSQRVQEEGTVATRRKGVQQGGETNAELRQPEDPRKGCRKIRQEKIEAAKKLPLPGYQGPAEELQEDPGKSPERWDETGERGSTGRPPPRTGENTSH